MLWEWIGFSCARTYELFTIHTASHKSWAMFSHGLCDVEPEGLESTVESSLAASGEKMAAGFGSRRIVRMHMDWIPAEEYERFRLWHSLASSNDRVVEGYMPVRLFDGLEEVGTYVLASGAHTPNVSWNDSGTYFSFSLDLLVKS